MTARYELRIHKGRREVANASRIAEYLNLNSKSTQDLLRRHLLAAASRDGARPQEAHLYHLDVHEVRDGRVHDRPVITYALPVEEAL